MSHILLNTNVNYSDNELHKRLKDILCEAV